MQTGINYLEQLEHALERLQEALAQKRKWQLLGELEADMTRIMAEYFVSQGKLFLEKLEYLKPWFDSRAAAVREGYIAEAEESLPPQWEGYLDQAQAESREPTKSKAMQRMRSALIKGAEEAEKNMGLGIRFDLSNPRAERYILYSGAELITRVERTTKNQIRNLLYDHIRQGSSYGTIAKDIRNQFSGFAGKKPQLHIRDRATLVAVTELGQAYEQGSYFYADQLRSDVYTPLPMEKKWNTVGDSRVSDGCKNNQAEGWIPFDDDFSSGHQHPLRFPGCRCTALYQVDLAALKKLNRERMTKLGEVGKHRTIEDATRWADANYPHIDWDFVDMHIDAVNPTLAQFDELARRYPQVAQRLEYVGGYSPNRVLKLDGKTPAPYREYEWGDRTWAHATRDGKNLGLNPKYYGDPDLLKEGLKTSRRTGWHPPGCDTIESIMTHEFGHQVDNFLQMAEDMVFNDVISADGFGSVAGTLKQWFDKHGLGGRKLSEYAGTGAATTQRAESFAEGFASMVHSKYADKVTWTRKFQRLVDTLTDFDEWTHINQATWTLDLRGGDREAAVSKIQKHRKYLGLENY